MPPELVQVQLTQGRVGADENGVTWAQSPGDIVEVDKDEAKRLLARGIAKAVKTKN